MRFNLRPYQEQAIAAIEERWEAGDRATLLVQATGTGKTIVMAGVTEDAVRDGGRVLILAHRGELLQQAADKLQSSTGLRCSVEKAEDTSVGTFERVTVGSRPDPAAARAPSGTRQGQVHAHPHRRMPSRRLLELSSSPWITLTARRCSA